VGVGVGGAYFIHSLSLSVEAILNSIIHDMRKIGITIRNFNLE